MSAWPPPRLARVRLKLMLSHPYLAAAVARLPLIDATASPWCDTMATDGYNIFVSLAFCDALSDDELTGVIAHELLHCVLGHGDRRGNRDRAAWNIATDHAINLLLQEAGFVLPADALADFQFRGLTAEQVYDRLVHPATGSTIKLNPGGGVDLHRAHGGFDKHLEPTDAHGHQQRLLDFPTVLERRRIRRELCAGLKSGIPGRLAGLLSQDIGIATAGRIDWRPLLARFISGLRYNDYRTYPFNRKHLWRGIYLPSVGAPGPRHLVVAIDTSGSMSPRLLLQVLAETDGLRRASACLLTVLQCDAQIQDVRQFEAWQLADVSFDNTVVRGRGGTDFKPVFEYIQDYTRAGGVDPDALVYLTGGFGAAPRQAPSWPVVWVVPTNGAKYLPFGYVIRIER